MDAGDTCVYLPAPVLYEAFHVFDVAMRATMGNPKTWSSHC